MNETVPRYRLLRAGETSAGVLHNGPARLGAFVSIEPSCWALLACARPPNPRRIGDPDPKQY